MIIADDMDDLYRAALSAVLEFGKDVTARNLDFKECTFQHLLLTNPMSRYVTNPMRKMSSRFLIAEFIWIMSGQAWLENLSFYNKGISKYSDDGVSLHGAYGPRLRNWPCNFGTLDQLSSCLQRLQNDLYTRQATMVILNPGVDFTEETKDVPCNDLLQFLYRDEQLDLCCYVRSNDLYLGFPYDVFHWTMLQEIFASILGVKVGYYHHFVGSLHIYKEHLTKAKEIIECETTSQQMNEMPKVHDLSIFDQLKKAEKEYREDGDVDISHLPQYWQSLFMYLVK